ncbi:hypothetical protein MSSAC_2378 [Methanosarcina siciliae C2J]|uniref:Uncharacterized protein n=1 Tax=Methanosarcina siciliae C2J TaxID=1434118 RepID=A0A0E3PP21_9EURY|nr:hypothetical protein MSSAC_2378 [Methanosarcina siciliae C2J]
MFSTGYHGTLLILIFCFLLFSCLTGENYFCAPKKDLLLTSGKIRYYRIIINNFYEQLKYLKTTKKRLKTYLKIG